MINLFLGRVWVRKKRKLKQITRGFFHSTWGGGLGGVLWFWGPRVGTGGREAFVAEALFSSMGQEGPMRGKLWAVFDSCGPFEVKPRFYTGRRGGESTRGERRNKCVFLEKESAERIGFYRYQCNEGDLYSQAFWVNERDTEAEERRSFINLIRRSVDEQ